MLALTAPPAEPIAHFDLLTGSDFAYSHIDVTIVPALAGVRVVLMHGGHLLWTARCASVQAAQAFAREYVASREFRVEQSAQANRSAFFVMPNRRTS